MLPLPTVLTPHVGLATECLSLLSRADTFGGLSTVYGPRSCTLGGGGALCGSTNGRPNCCDPPAASGYPNTCGTYNSGSTQGLQCSACNINCKGNITTYFINTCQGRNSCSFTASNSVADGGDPCVGTYKYTNVSYLCIGG